MAGAVQLTVRTEDLRVAASTVHGWTRELERVASADLVGSVLHARAVLPGARCEPALGDLLTALREVMSDLLAAAGGLAGGLEGAAEAYEQWEVSAARSATVVGS